MQTQVSSVRAGGAVVLKDVRKSVRGRGRMKQDSPSSCPSRFLRRCRSRRWLITDSVPVSLSRPSLLLAALGLSQNKWEQSLHSSLFPLFHTDSHSCWCSSQKTALRLSAANCPGLLGPPRNHLRGEKKTQKTT